jgi:hypothetical protein
VSIVGPVEARPVDSLTVDFVVEPDRAQLGEIVQRVRDEHRQHRDPRIRPSDAGGRQSSAFVRERHAPIDARSRPALSRSAGYVLSDPPG